jgi:hypothetical protein
MNGHERALVGQVSLRKMGTSGRVRKGSPHEGGFPSYVSLSWFW